MAHLVQLIVADGLRPYDRQDLLHIPVGRGKDGNAGAGEGDLGGGCKVKHSVLRARLGAHPKNIRQLIAAIRVQVMHRVGIVPEDAEIRCRRAHTCQSAHRLVRVRVAVRIGIFRAAPDALDGIVGGDEALDLLISEAKKRGIGIILDGVFNHTGDDSVYFNRYGNYPDTGAYQSEKSPYYNWYTFRHFPDDYECWWNIKILPRVRCDEPSYREFICGDGGVLEKWMRKGVRGFRLDVADELSDGFIASIRKKIKKETSDGVLYGEVWENASNKVAYSTRREYFRGKELDSVMNYPLRKAVIEYLRNGKAAQFKTLLYDVYGTYPPFASRLLMNFLGTHDTERIITALAAPPWDGKSNDELAVLKMNENERARGEKLVKLALALVFTVPGVPCVFYGDEVGVEGYHDPFNRRTFPWGHENCSLADFLRTLSVIRAENSVFKDGDFRICEATAEYLILERKNADGGILTVVNRSDKTLTLAFESPVLNLLNGDEVSVITVSGLTCSMLRFDGETPDYEIE